MRSPLPILIIAALLGCCASPLRADEPVVLKGHEGWVGGVAFTPDGATLATASADKTVRLWETATGKLKATLKGHDDVVTSVAFSPDGKLLASGSFDRTVRVWDVAKSEERRKLTGHRGAVQCVAFHPDGKVLASGSIDATARLWDFEKGEESARLTRHKSWVNAVAFSGNGNTLLTGSSDGTVRVWQTDGTKEEHVFDLSKIGEVRSVAVARDGKTAAAGMRYGSVRVLDVRDRREIVTLPAHAGDAWGAVFIPDSDDVLITAGGDWNLPGEVKVWDAGTKKAQRTLPHSGEVLCVSVTKDGRYLAAGSWDKTVRVWKLPAEKGRE